MRNPFTRSQIGRGNGQSVVEFAIILPVMLLLFAGAADLGRLFYNFVAVENAVKEGALYGSRYPICDDASSLCPNPDNVQWRTENEARLAGGGALATPTSACLNAASGVAYVDLRDCVAGDTYVVSATIQFVPLTPILGQIVGGTISLTSESRAVVLNVAFDPTPGLAPTKFVLGTTARNAVELAANCEQPDPIGSPNYYRSPCLDVVAPIDTTNPFYNATFRTGDTISYKVSVRNNGGTNTTGVTITDSLGWPGSCPARPATLAVNASYTCSYTRPAPAVSGSGDVSDYINTLTADSAETLPAADAATVKIERPPADLVALKLVSVFRLGDDGDGPFGVAHATSIAYNAQVPSPSVWYKLSVQNQGGRTANGITITDSNGALPTNADCPARPTSVVAGGAWVCYYQKGFTSAQTYANTVTVTSPDSPPDGNDSDTATVTVSQCTGTNKVVPNLIGLVKAPAVSAWNPGAGFTSTLSTWGGNAGSTVATQSRTAFTCIAANSTMTVTR